MNATSRAVLAFSLFIAPAAFATKVPIPIEGATLNISFQLQTQALFQEAGTPVGDGWSTDLFVRRSRLLVNGDISQNFTYLVQLDNANFGKYGNFNGRAIVQDAWIGWAPTGITGGTVVYIDAGILLIPFSHQGLESTTNFITADLQSDAFRFPGNGFAAFRDTGVQVRGWALDKKVGFRGGVFEGYTPILQPSAAAATAANPACVPDQGTCITPKRYPAFRGFVNLDLIGSEEGGWLYGAYKWGKDPILSVGLAGSYQSQAVRTAVGNLADQRLFAADVYFNFPMTEAAELVAEGTYYLNGNGTGSANTGTGVAASVGYRFGAIAPYLAYDYFQAADCSALILSTAQTTQCNTAVESANSRNLKAGVNFFFNKNLNHLSVEFQVNHGFSAYGPSNVTAAAGYTPLSLDPDTAGGPRRAFNANLRNPAFKSVLLHWNVIF